MRGAESKKYLALKNGLFDCLAMMQKARAADRAATAGRSRKAGPTIKKTRA